MAERLELYIEMTPYSFKFSHLIGFFSLYHDNHISAVILFNNLIFQQYLWCLLLSTYYIVLFYLSLDNNSPSMDFQSD